MHHTTERNENLQARIETLLMVQVKEIQRIRMTLEGNGRAGLVERMAVAEDRLQTHKKAGAIAVVCLGVLVPGLVFVGEFFLF